MDKEALIAWYSKRFVVEETAEDVVKSFEVFDREGKGLISNPELRHVLTGLGDRLDPAQVEPMIQQADQGDGQIAYRTFIDIMIKNASGR